MIWILTIVGALVGLVVNGWGGFFALGFLGWIAGFIIKSSRPPKAPAPDQRLQALERRVAALERQLASPRMGSEPFIEEKGTDPLVESPVAEPVRLGTGLESAMADSEAPPIRSESVPVSPDSESVPLPPGSGSVPFSPEKGSDPLIAWFTGGNTIVRVGLVILFVGLAFLVKYGVEHQMIPVELRIAAVAAAGLAMLIVGWRLREKRPGYALSMQGAGVAVLYLTVFGALKLYHLLPAGMAFALLVVIAAAAAVLAVKQDSLALAVFGTAGGFLAPVLASTGGGSHVTLFSYYFVLNGAIVAIAWYRSWRILNVVGFLFTFLIGLAWGVRFYQPEYFDTTEPFLLAFFFMYLAIAILFARGQIAAHRSYIDATIVFGVPIAAFGLQAGLMRGSEFGLAFSSLDAGAIYLVLTELLKRYGQRWRMLAESFLALGVVFVSLAIPLALDARWTSAAWAIEGAAIVWIGVRQRRKVACGFGAFLQLAAGAAFLRGYPAMHGDIPLVDAKFIGAVLLSAAGLLTYRVLRPTLTGPHASFSPIAGLFFVWGALWWLFGGTHEILTFLDNEYQVNAMVAFYSATVLVFSLMGERENWEAARWPTWFLAPVLLILAIINIIDRPDPMRDAGWIAWPFAFIVHFAILRRQEDVLPVRWTQWLHAIGVVVLAILGAEELVWIADSVTASGTAWSLASRIVVPAALILLISSHKADDMWPVRDHLAAYRKGAVLVLLGAMAVWSLHINFEHAGASDPLPYIPFLNAIDLGHIFAGIAIVSWWRSLARSELKVPALLEGKAGIAVVSFFAFFWLNAALLRTIHHWTGVPYNFNSLWGSVVVQASLSIFWSVLALTLMLVATRIGRRSVWIVGAALMAVVVLKLLMVDLSRLAGIERIVSFIGVGVLMLVIGYFSPVPPRVVAPAINVTPTKAGGQA
jgi:uncharacterized membrane protein